MLYIKQKQIPIGKIQNSIFGKKLLSSARTLFFSLFLAFSPFKRDPYQLYDLFPQYRIGNEMVNINLGKNEQFNEKSKHFVLLIEAGDEETFFTTKNVINGIGKEFNIIFLKASSKSDIEMALALLREKLIKISILIMFAHGSEKAIYLYDSNITKDDKGFFYKLKNSFEENIMPLIILVSCNTAKEIAQAIADYTKALVIAPYDYVIPPNFIALEKNGNIFFAYKDPFEKDILLPIIRRKIKEQGYEVVNTNLETIDEIEEHLFWNKIRFIWPR
jgi:tetratricopeptide (TPR) repeat protein